MHVKQYVMAYRGGHDRIRALLPEGYESLRPVLRLNVEIQTKDEAEKVRIEFNTPVAAHGKRGWLNLKVWETPETAITWQESDKHFGEAITGDGDAAKGMTVTFTSPCLDIEFTGVGLMGGCPAEGDNDGCFYLDGGETAFVPAEKIDRNKEYCDCEFTWTDPFMEAMKIPKEELLGAYWVEFDRKDG